MAISSMIGFIFVLLCILLVVMTVKSFPAISCRFGGSEEAFADNAGYYAPCLAASIPPWEQSAATVAFRLPEEHTTDEALLALHGSVFFFN